MKKRLQVNCLALIAFQLTAWLMLPPAHAADTIWTNVPAGGSWAAAGNWDNGVPTNNNAFLTNSTASYSVNYDAAAPMFQKLMVSNATANTTTFNINATGFSTTNGIRLERGGVINVNTSGFSVAGINADSLGANIRGTLNVNDGGRAIMRVTKEIHVEGGRMTVNSNGVLRFYQTDNLNLSSGGNITVNQGGVFTNDFRFLIGRSGVGAVTNRGTFVKLGLDTPIDIGFPGGTGTLSMEGGLFDNSAGRSLGPNRGGFRVAEGDTTAAAGAIVMTGGTVINGGDLWVAAVRNNKVNYLKGSLSISGGDWLNTSPSNTVIGGYNHEFGNTNVASGGWVGNITNVAGLLTVSGTGKFVALGDVLAGAGCSGVVSVAGGQMFVTNASGTAGLLLGTTGGAVSTIGYGTLLLTGGALTADRLVTTNGANGVIVFSGGMLSTKTAIIAKGSALTAGGGSSTATLVLRTGGSYTFSDGLTLATNGVLATGGTNAIGAATVTGNVTLQSGAILDCDYSASTNDWTQITGSLTLPATASLSVRVLDSSLRNTIPIMQAASIIGTTSGWGPVVVKGRKFRAVVVNGNQLQLAHVLDGTLIAVW